MNIEENIKWNIIRNQKDVDEFMESVFGFHDSCIKECKYISGAYVKDNLSMFPINSMRTLRIIIQRQFKENSMIEMKFYGLKKLIMAPADENYTCEILDSELVFKDGLIWWTDGSVENDEVPKTFLVCAAGLQWRNIDGYMGDKEFYSTVEHDVWKTTKNDA